MTNQRAPLVWRLLLAAATIFAVTMALLPHPPNVVEVGDKYQHMAAFGTLTILYALAFPATPRRRRPSAMTASTTMMMKVSATQSMTSQSRWSDGID